MRKVIYREWRHGHGGGRGIAPLLLLALTLILVPLAAGCSPQSMAQSATATTSGQATQIADPTPTATAVTPGPDLTPTTFLAIATSTVSITGTSSITATAVVTSAGTPGVRPTPSGEAPDPASVLSIFQFFSPSDTLVARDFVNLDGVNGDEVLYTIAGSRFPITSETKSGIGVLSYDATYREWTPLWATPPLTGTTSPLPSINRKEAGGYNGGDLLGNIGPILAARTNTIDGKAHLYLWRWNKDTQEGEALKMLPEGGAERDAIFDADLDVNLADITDDGIYEVVLDNVANVQVWVWDGNRFVPRGDR